MNEGKEELDELREAVREFLAAKSPAGAVRAAMDTGYDPAVWDQMARQLRLPGLALPSEYGGDGSGLTELEVVLEEMGAALACSPFFATVVLAAQALLASADAAACARYLPGIAAGRTIATLAAAEGSASWDPAMVAARAERTAAGWRLLALVLGSGLPGCDAIELAAVLIGESGGLPALATADPHALKRLPGIGAGKAARVAAAFELARRAAVARDRRRIAGSADVAAVAAPYLRGLRHERVVVVACDTSGSLLRVASLTDGSADRSLIPVRDVLTAVLAVGGVSFAVAHNHPSGSLTPSESDTEVTVRLRQAAGTVGLRFLDRIILNETAWARVLLLRVTRQTLH